MKKMLILGAGHVTKPLVNYLTTKCGFEVTIAAPNVAKAEEIIADRPLAKCVSWWNYEDEKLDGLISTHDLVINMIPKAYHEGVAKCCIKNRKSMVTTCYEIPPIRALDAAAQKAGVLILNELGEDPGMDHFATQMLLKAIREEHGKVISIHSYGSGLPSYRFNNNPLGYKFSWEPKGVFLAAQVPALWLDKGKPVTVSAGELFDDFQMVDIEGIGAFEAYANKDASRYVSHFELPDDVTFFRGLLRFSGYCNNMRNFIKLGLLNDRDTLDFSGMTYRDFAAMLIDVKPDEHLEAAVAKHLGVEHLADIMMRLRWLGFFDTSPIGLERGTRLDAFVKLLLARLAYAPGETDMTIIHVEIVSKYPDGRRDRRTVTMVKDGEPYGDSAMAMAVGLSPAIAARLIMEEQIPEVGVQLPPSLPYLHEQFLRELGEYGFHFNQTKTEL